MKDRSRTSIGYPPSSIEHLGVDPIPLPCRTMAFWIINSIWGLALASEVASAIEQLLNRPGLIGCSIFQSPSMAPPRLLMCSTERSSFMGTMGHIAPVIISAGLREGATT